MKQLSNKLLRAGLICLLVTGFYSITNAQQKLIHFWHFNNLSTGTSAAGSPSLLKPIHANWSVLDSTKALISFVPNGTVSAKYTTYWDNVAGDASDTFNLLVAGPTGAASSNNALRMRNPSDSMELLFAMPTTNYKNITLRFATEKSSNGAGASAPANLYFDYSVNNGTTWITSGIEGCISFPKDSFNNGNFNLVTISFAGDPAVNNNNGFIFRIKSGAPNAVVGGKASGNIRFDNVSLQGDSIGKAQKLIHYWHFNTLNTGTSAAGSVSLLKPIKADYSTISTTQATILDTPAYKVSSHYMTYWDNVGGDTINSRLSAKGVTASNNALRVRNPNDSMELLFRLPTTGYKNITLKYELELSSFGPTGSGAGRELFSYSVDGGKTWRQKGMSINMDSITNGTWNLISINFGADAAVNNNANFQFMIRTTPPNAITSGNHRYDNVTLEGDSLGVHVHNSGIEQILNDFLCNLYPNPAQTQVIVSTGSDKAKTISIMSMEGKVIYSTVNSAENVPLDITSLRSGVYFVNVIENQTGKIAYLRLIKY